MSIKMPLWSLLVPFLYTYVTHAKRYTPAKPLQTSLLHKQKVKAGRIIVLLVLHPTFDPLLFCIAESQRLLADIELYNFYFHQ